MPPRTETTTALTDQDVYNEMIATIKTIKHVALDLFADEGITQAQLQALELLVAKGPMLMRELSEAMVVSPANVTGIVDRLEEKKLVQRTSGKGDRRATIIEITPDGKTLYEELGRKKTEMIQKSLAQFTKEERITLTRLLEKFQSGMSRCIAGKE
jgi:DNA-binding MarR family transcriptional regulator